MTANLAALAYLAAGNFEPFVSATLEYDYTQTELQFAAGVAAPEKDTSGSL